MQTERPIVNNRDDLYAYKSLQGPAVPIVLCEKPNEMQEENVKNRNECAQ
jgi:hypothetical protein